LGHEIDAIESAKSERLGYGRGNAAGYLDERWLIAEQFRSRTDETSAVSKVACPYIIIPYDLSAETEQPGASAVRSEHD
jgi:hypothetical protein